MSGSKHGGPHSLSRRLRGDDNSESDKKDVGDAMDVDLAVLRGEPERDNDQQVDATEEEEELEGENEHERATGHHAPEDEAPENDTPENDTPENDAPENDIPEDFRNVIHYLTTFERPEGLTRKKYLQFSASQLNFSCKIASCLDAQNLIYCLSKLFGI